MLGFSNLRPEWKLELQINQAYFVSFLVYRQLIRSEL